MDLRRTIPATVALTLCSLATVFSSTPAFAAADASSPNEIYLFTSTIQECTATGEAGTNDRLFDQYQCRNGFAGYDLLVQPTATATNTWQGVGYPTNRSVCEQRAAAGSNGGAWSQHYCRNGFAGYDLMVLG